MLPKYELIFNSFLNNFPCIYFRPKIYGQNMVNSLDLKLKVHKHSIIYIKIC